MNDYLVTSPITSDVTTDSKPTPTTAVSDATARTTEMEKGMTAPMNTRDNTPSITLGTSPIGA